MVHIVSGIKVLILTLIARKTLLPCKSLIMVHPKKWVDYYWSLKCSTIYSRSTYVVDYIFCPRWCLWDQVSSRCPGRRLDRSISSGLQCRSRWPEFYLEHRFSRTRCIYVRLLRFYAITLDWNWSRIGDAANELVAIQIPKNRPGPVSLDSEWFIGIQWT